MWIDYVRSFFKLSPLQIIALTAYGEARGEGKIGMQAVINVIHNRRLHPPQYFQDSDILEETGSPYHAVCLKKYQFSSYNLGDPQRGILLRLSDPNTFDAELQNNLSLRRAWEVCQDLAAGRLTEITGGADHYFATYIKRPDWTKGMVYRTTIGNHEFWSDPPHISEQPQVFRPEKTLTITPTEELLKVVVPSTIAGTIPPL